MIERDVTIKDVAREANVSIATVSRVVNGNYIVSEDLKERVFAAIKSLNYVPNSIARSLKIDHTLTIGLIVSDISNSYFTALARSAEDIIMKKGYNLIVCSTDDKKEKEASYLKLLLEKKVDGILLNTTGKNDDLISEISKSIPVGLCSRKIKNPEFIGDFVEVDNLNGAYTLTKHLLSLGHRKIAVINGQKHISSSVERYNGFLKAMEEFGIEPPETNPYHYHGNFNSPDSGESGVEYLLSLPHPPTAVITMNNELALGVIRYTMRHGIKVPDELSICSFGQITNSELMLIQPTYVTMDPASMGTTLSEMVIERISHKQNIPSREVRYTTTLVHGNAVSPIG
ncbi:LacI family DNA-binding transcriptional regulator [Proteiniclasticum sp.]|uniref:LacI family DNA-binding transcriptional regulator n=1 Tax=Proteiniclasticum sp. TaxID=2053595 RepID=UPI00289AD46A|nr:LacI family DNA-binding transcriptional regulator [Proteiniclasticum sp.]